MKRPKKKTHNILLTYSLSQDTYIDQLEAENKELKIDARAYKLFRHLGASELLKQISALNNRNTKLKATIERVDENYIPCASIPCDYDKHNLSVAEIGYCPECKQELYTKEI